MAIRKFFRVAFLLVLIRAISFYVPYVMPFLARCMAYLHYIRLKRSKKQSEVKTQWKNQSASRLIKIYTMVNILRLYRS